MVRPALRVPTMIVDAVSPVEDAVTAPFPTLSEPEVARPEVLVVVAFDVEAYT